MDDAVPCSAESSIRPVAPVSKVAKNCSPRMGLYGFRSKPLDLLRLAYIPGKLLMNHLSTATILSTSCIYTSLTCVVMYGTFGSWGLRHGIKEVRVFGPMNAILQQTDAIQNDSRTCQRVQVTRSTASRQALYKLHQHRAKGDRGGRARSRFGFQFGKGGGVGRAGHGDGFGGADGWGFLLKVKAAMSTSNSFSAIM